jgi:hypothetical protein
MKRNLTVKKAISVSSQLLHPGGQEDHQDEQGARDTDHTAAERGKKTAKHDSTLQHQAAGGQHIS